MVRTALHSLPRKASPLIRSDLLGLESRAFAQLGDGEAGCVAGPRSLGAGCPR
jgi:hypothetical protein